MKKRLLLKLIQCTILLGLISCKKTSSINEKPIKAEVQIAKITSINQTTGVETPMIEFEYNSQNNIIAATYLNINWVVSYNSNNKMSLVSGANSVMNGNFTLTYNTNEQLDKIVYVGNIPSYNNFTKTFEYNASGKLNKMTVTYLNSSIDRVIYDFTWTNNNVSSIAISNNGNYLMNFSGYDNKLDPFSLIEPFCYMFLGVTTSTNNAAQIKITNPSNSTVIQDRSFQYYNNGYLSMIIPKSPGNSQKIYYR